MAGPAEKLKEVFKVMSDLELGKSRDPVEDLRWVKSMVTDWQSKTWSGSEAPYYEQEDVQWIERVHEWLHRRM